MTTIYLIRHAESEGNLFRTCQGHYDELLSPVGLQQCKALHQRFRKIHVDAVYSSDLYRAALTAQSIVRAQSPAVPHYADRDLREKGLGILEGKSWGTVYHLYPELRTNGVRNTHDIGGETDDELWQRVCASMQRMVRLHPGKTLAAISHGGAISSFLKGTFPGDERLSKVGGNTGVTTLHYDEGRWELIEHNDLSHLEKAGIPCVPLFREDVTDLWYAPVDYERDEETLRRLGTQAWLAVYGSTDQFNAQIFLDNARKMCRFEGCASLCMDGDKVAGLLLLDPMQDEEPGVGHISLVYLEPEYRGRGIGCQLLGRAGVVYRSMGMQTLRLNVARQNKTAIRFYEKYGFRSASLSRPRGGLLVMKKDVRIPHIEMEPVTR